MDIILEKSLINTHCKGLDSIVVKETLQLIGVRR